MEAFTGVAFGVASFFLLFCFLFLWVGFRLPRSQGKDMFLSARVGLFFFAALFFMMSFFSVYISLAYGVSLTNRAPCENVVNQSAYNLSSEVTTYTYTDSCLTREAPTSVSSLYSVFGWVTYALMFTLFVGLFIVGFRRLFFRW